ncbi:MAG: 2-oxoacid:acceptor oxidoreductase, gamma subunit, pyruvate/2-ketoisovalerate family [Parcubacteria group bacterium GW2011_GWA2_43_9b]|nr:MAG: 2-oxoacid:acceptor oxidoreductase, gamma subunit, pyruvate/2-ketoisovalerate family [Parcubacteria group bacterium GW2011_GWA2_43_9b]
MKKAQIIIVGMGGQGVQTIAKILALAIVQNGCNVSYIPRFGVEQRGTPSVAFIKSDPDKINYPLFNVADWLLILHPGARAEAAGYIDKKTQIIFDSSLMAANQINGNLSNFFGLPAVKLANDNFSGRSANLIFLGKISKELGLPFEVVWQEMLKVLGKKFKSGAVKEEGRQALLAGYESSSEKGIFFQPTHQPSKGMINLKGGGKQLFLAPERCKGCGICIVKCPVGAIKFGRRASAFATPLPEVDLDKCNVCGNCFLYCPDGAIKVEKKNKKYGDN